MGLDFVEVGYEDPHRARARRIRESHPEVKGWVGKNAWTGLWGVLVVCVHVGLGIWCGLGDLAWWWVLCLSWCVGAFLSHGLFAVIHEACHGLVFGRRWANRMLMLWSNLPLLAPFAIPLGHYHMVHHRVQGQRGRDPDLPAAWELRIFGGSMWGKWAWHVLFPVLQLFRLHNDPRDAFSPWDGWFLAGVMVQSLAVFACIWWLGMGGLLYFVCSLYFMFALHPLSGRFVQEHFVLEGTQETNSYYGVLNATCLNFGLHTEHHDFPGIPWHRLPALARLAPEAYEGRQRYRSWGLLWLRFLFDPRYKLHGRIVRAPQP